MSESASLGFSRCIDAAVVAIVTQKSRPATGYFLLEKCWNRNNNVIISFATVIMSQYCVI